MSRERCAHNKRMLSMWSKGHRKTQQDKLTA